MSAPSLAIPAAPAPGHAVASKRGAATADADFAALLDETSATEAPAKAAPAAPAKTDTTAAPVEDAPVETPTDAAPADPAPVAVPGPVAPPVVVDAKPEAGPAAPVAAAAAAAAAAHSLDLTPPPAEDATEASAAVPTDAADDKAAAAPPADLPDFAALQPEPAKTPAPAAATPPPAAVVASPAPRPAKAAEPVVSTETPDDAPAVPTHGTPALIETAAPLPVEAPRTRDVIDRAQAGRTETPAASSTAEAEPEAAASNASPTATPATAPAAQTSSRPTVVAEAAAAPAPADTDGATPLAPAPTTPTEARAAETPVSLALSTLSHATIQTTAQIAAQIVRKLEGRSTRFEMALTPEGLGNVDVSLDIDADGKLLARMAFDNPIAATELRGRVDELRRQLQEAGFIVADDALSFTERDASAGQQGSAFDRRPDTRNARAFGAASRLQADADRIAMPAAWIPLTLTPDRVDMKV